MEHYADTSSVRTPVVGGARSSQPFHSPRLRGSQAGAPLLPGSDWLCLEGSGGDGKSPAPFSHAVLAASAPRCSDLCVGRWCSTLGPLVNFALRTKGALGVLSPRGLGGESTEAGHPVRPPRGARAWLRHHIIHILKASWTETTEHKET
ncbi:unnamed protein product [Pleuronectes platessa]|uniref:Uncharacterized protein n=1 Tax=Pleuronectes platessa TaxID=8262 RepID=A0A9N7VSI6_PLEPL|nr:unnamed protein product [Pleuronectes platessa]